MKRILNCLLAAIFATDMAAQTEVPQEVMQRVYEEAQTPYKYGLVMTAPQADQMTDCPMIFRKGRTWYMYYVVYDGRGYETWLATSSDLLEWQTQGRVMSFGGEWDRDQKAGYLSLVDPTWGGKYGMEKYKGRYWMTYFGSNATGYEQGDLAVGVAYTEQKPTAAHEWQRMAQPVFSPKDSDARWWDNDKIYKNTVWRDTERLTGHTFVMFYNAKGSTAIDGNAANVERISMAVSDDMEHWQRYGEGPVLDHRSGITGDAYLQRMGNLWVMFYFGHGWTADTKRKAWDTFACSYDLVHWTDWTGKPLVEASPEADAPDNKYAHKPCIIKYKGVVYHFYCAVDQQGRRGIALATSKDFGKSTLNYPMP